MNASLNSMDGLCCSMNTSPYLWGECLETVNFMKHSDYCSISLYSLEGVGMHQTIIIKLNLTFHSVLSLFGKKHLYDLYFFISSSSGLYIDQFELQVSLSNTYLWKILNVIHIFIESTQFWIADGKSTHMQGRCTL